MRLPGNFRAVIGREPGKKGRAAGGICQATIILEV